MSVPGNFHHDRCGDAQARSPRPPTVEGVTFAASDGFVWRFSTGAWVPYPRVQAEILLTAFRRDQADPNEPMAARMGQLADEIARALADLDQSQMETAA
jgi:hypothetical protein